MRENMIAVIFANGTLDDSPELATRINQADIVIAADGGANHCHRLNITPDILIGDLDSIDPALLASYQNKEIVIHRHPPRKDATDLELALDLALEKGARTSLLLGALGGRWDMSLANLMLAASAKYKNQKISLWGQDCSMQILHPGKPCIIRGRPEQKVSLVPLKGDVHGVTLTGFSYPLNRQTILFGSSRGVSNIMDGDQAMVQHTEGVLLCVLFRE